MTKSHDCSCLPWLDKLRLLHEEGKVEEFVVHYKVKDDKNVKVLMHRGSARFLLETAMWDIEEALKAELETE